MSYGEFSPLPLSLDNGETTEQLCSRIAPTAWVCRDGQVRPSFLRRFRTGAVATLVLFTLLSRPHSIKAAAPASADAEKNFTLPILSVSKDDVGRCSRPKFSFTRRVGDAAPLSLAVIEDTPGGAGESIRASMWLAAMVAALDRMDPLSGARISLELSGSVDGPSAGAGICLAILSALDGREFPSDCAVTGAIMPDGTIGGVGGIAPKLRAAAQAGIHRVLIPNYVRFEEQPGVDEEVDLKRLAQQLKIDLIRVENVGQAYAAIHRTVATPVLPPDRTVLDLPETTEEALKGQYQTHYKAGLELWNAIPENERKSLAESPTLKSIFIDERASASSAYRAGRLSIAGESMWMWRLAVQSRTAMNADLGFAQPKGLEQGDLAALANDIKAALAKRLKAVPEAELVIGQVKGSESMAQLYADFYDRVGDIGLIDYLEAKIDQQLSAATKPELTKEQREQIRDEIYGLGCLQVFIAQHGLATFQGWGKELEAISATLPHRPITEDAPAIDRLFFNAQLATRNTFRHDVISQWSDKLGVSGNAIIDTLTLLDMTFVTHARATKAAQDVHTRALAATEPTARRFTAAVSAHLQARSLSTQSGLIARWNLLDMEVGENGEFIYGRTDLLNYLLTAARENALRAIGECRKAEIVCLGPIARFETAELSRDDSGADKVDVLIEYWNASLQAKVLLMLCGSTKNEPVPNKSAAAGTLRARVAEPPKPTTYVAVPPMPTQSSGTLAPKAAATTFKPSLPALGLNPPDPLGLRSPSFGSPGYRPFPSTNSPRPYFGYGRRDSGLGTNSSNGSPAGWFIVISVVAAYCLLGLWTKRKPAEIVVPSRPPLEVVAVTPPEDAGVVAEGRRKLSGSWPFRAVIGFLVVVASIGAVSLAGTILWLLAYLVGVV